MLLNCNCAKLANFEDFYFKHARGVCSWTQCIIEVMETKLKWVTSVDWTMDSQCATMTRTLSAHRATVSPVNTYSTVL